MNAAMQDKLTEVQKWQDYHLQKLNLFPLRYDQITKGTIEFDQNAV